MKAIWLTIPAVAALLFAGAASADLDLAKKSGCLGCHKIEGKGAGPAWKDVGTKYAAMADGKASILHSIKNGSEGKWNAMMKKMPAQGRVSAENAGKLADFILSLK